jgi:ComF family protein
LRKRPLYSRHRSCSRYRGRLKDIILLYKYRHFRALGKDLARFAYDIFGQNEELWWGVQAVLAVPLHPKRRKERGFNQAQIIAQELARLQEIEFIAHGLIKVKNVPPQTFLREEERINNVSGAFRVRNKGNMSGKVILLVDDVYTTGSTIQECSSMLRDAGIKEVRALTIAQA